MEPPIRGCEVSALLCELMPLTATMRERLRAGIGRAVSARYPGMAVRLEGRPHKEEERRRK
jgi:hypothetical protein